MIVTLCSCNHRPHGTITETGTLPVIDPDYTGVTIPYNIAPLNFKIPDKGSAYFARISGGSRNFNGDRE